MGGDGADMLGMGNLDTLIFCRSNSVAVPMVQQPLQICCNHTMSSFSILHDYSSLLLAL